MTLLTKWLGGLIAGLLVLTCSATSEHGTKPEAIAMAQKAVGYYKANNKDKAFAEISNKSGQFIDRDMYVYVIDTNAVMLAHGANEKLVGKTLLQLKDADGKLFLQDVVALIKSGKSGWVDYKWPNPVTKAIEQKTTYVEPSGDYGFAVGVYK